MKSFVLECCVDSVESAVAAQQGGATRLELCADLPLGGTTPGLSLFRQVRRHCSLPVHVLLRPRFGDFCYTPYEMDILAEDAAVFSSQGADAVVIGVLRPDGSLDVRAMARLIAAASGARITLHRAFDLCREPMEALEQAIELGVNTILTSGQQANAALGTDLLKALGQRAGPRLEVMAGAGVSSESLAQLAVSTGLSAFHMTGKRLLESPMTYRREGVPMGLPGMSEFSIWRTDALEIAAARRILESL